MFTLPVGLESTAALTAVGTIETCVCIKSRTTDVMEVTRIFDSVTDKVTAYAVAS